MHEEVKSRSSTAQWEYVKHGLTESLQLLQKWNLLELQNTFIEHDITLRSLIYITEQEICELIPKIGVRTIFGAMLKEWRQTYYAISYPRASTSSQCELECDSYLDQIELKTECSVTSNDIFNSEIDQNYLQSKCSKENPEMEHDVETTNDEMQAVSKFFNTKKLRKSFSYEENAFIVLDILNSCTDGQTALEFYKIHKFLDVKNRKRIVNLLVRTIVERKVEKYTAIFHDMTRQLLQLFPTEKYETYFVPHNSPNSARGALYYRYSNYTRQLRKEGLLSYKIKSKNCLRATE